MSGKRQKILFLCAAMLILILDGKTAISGASQGLQLCLQSVIPSLFPFFVISGILTDALSGCRIPLMGGICRLCGIPRGGESLLLVGLLGGYPVGAQNIDRACQTGTISANTARRLLGFCNHAGPSFLFGIVALAFDNPWVSWLLWGIQIVSAIAVGALLPEKRVETVHLSQGKGIDLPQALQSSISVMAKVCTWVVLFRILLAFLNRWILWVLPIWMQVLITGVLELSNGCCQLSQIPSEGLRFVCAAGMLSFGGLCVGMQTVSVTASTGTGSYFPGKLLQTAISLFLSLLLQPLFPGDQRISNCGIWCFICGFLLVCGIFAGKMKNRLEIPKELVYNP